MDSKSILDLAKTLLDHDFDEYEDRFHREMPEGYLDVDPSAMVNKLRLCLKSLISAGETDKMSLLPVRLLSEVHNSLSHIQSELDSNRPVSQTAPRIANLEQLLWIARVLGGQDHAGVVLSEIGILQETLDEVQRARHEINGFRANLGAAENQLESARMADTAINDVLKNLREMQTKVAGVADQVAGLLLKTEKDRADVQSLKVSAESAVTDMNKWSADVEIIYENARSSSDEFEQSKAMFDRFLQKEESNHSERMQRVDQLLQNATGVSLFAAFEQKRKSFMRISFAWASLSLIAMSAAIWFALHLANAYSANSVGIGTGFWVKLSITPLFVLLIGFCSAQYARSKRTEDEYAFKSTLSLSLEPYRKLVSRMTDEQMNDSHMVFVVDIIREIYSSPYDLRATINDKKVDEKLEKRFSEMLLSLAKNQAGISDTSK